MLEICGRDDASDAYYSEMVVFYATGNELIAIEPVYWAGIRIADDRDVGENIGVDPASRCE